uniref:Uncharacterized protein n=1 Tax=Lepeophtheirus salmonis TaxID=72036 RepID=A0A0K2URV4_LEPSM
MSYPIKQGVSSEQEKPGSFAPIERFIDLIRWYFLHRWWKTSHTYFRKKRVKQQTSFLNFIVFIFLWGLLIGIKVLQNMKTRMFC